MLTLNVLSPAKGSVKNKKRIGRGQGSGQGCTAGKGMNGAKARSGAKNRPYFEGGQMPLHRRLPKRGFNSPFKKYFQIVNVGDLEKYENLVKEIDITWLFKNGFVHSLNEPVKILGNGDLTKSFSVKVHAFSKSAREKIENVKGKAEVI